MKPIKFTATIKKSPGKGGWHFIQLSPELREELRKRSGKNGNVPVVMTIGKSSWPSTTMSMGNQQWFVAVKAAVRKSEDLAEGDTVSVSITPDQSRLS